MKIDLAISPCPNDCFIFCRLSQEGISGNPVRLLFADVEELNRRAVYEQRHSVSKMSFPAFFQTQLRQDYDLLPCGGAMGYDCGPILISYEKQSAKEALRLMKRVAVPGLWTTAHLLLQLYLREQGMDHKSVELCPMSYDAILPALQIGDFDYGVIIHEERFSFLQEGCHSLQDLGQWWQARTKQPIALGCIAVRKDFPAKLRPALEQSLRNSINFAKQNPASVWPFIKGHAQALDNEVIASHIKLYVNDFSMDFGLEGHKAIESLREMWQSTQTHT